jgi:outer membrane protein assembly factor BamB/type 1 glutamine amidotransferase
MKQTVLSPIDKLSMRKLTLLILSLSLSANMVIAADQDAKKDWPQWRGPNRDGIVPNSLPLSWSAAGPKRLWKSEPLPSMEDGGFGSVTVAGGKVYLLVAWKSGFEGASERQDVIVCLEEETGKTLWKVGYPGIGTDHASSSMPCVADNKVFVCGVACLYCLDAESGTLLWKTGEIGKQISSSPLYLDGMVIVSANSLFAYDAATGKELWRQDEAAGGPSFEGVPHTSNNCSPAVWYKDGINYIINCGTKLTCVEAKTGAVKWQAPGPGGASATPAICGDYVVINYGLGRGTYAYRMTLEKAEQIWRISKSDRGSTPVILDGLVYAYGGGSYACYELATGQEKWKQPSSGEISSPVVADGKIFGFYDGCAGIVVFKPTADKYTEIDRLSINACNATTPTIANGKLFIRAYERVACYALTPAGHNLPLPELAAIAGKPIRINVGGKTDWTDSNGNTWMADRFADDGAVFEWGDIPIQGTNLGRIYQSERRDVTGYTLHVADGDYTVRAHFCENYEGIPEEGLRVMTLDINGVVVRNVDPFGETGARSIPLVKQVYTSVTNGLLKIDLHAQGSETILNGLEIIPGRLPELEAMLWPEPQPQPKAPSTSPRDRGVAMAVGIIDIPGLANTYAQIKPEVWIAGLQNIKLADYKVAIKRLTTVEDLVNALAHPETWLAILNPYGEHFVSAGPGRWQEMVASIRHYVRNGGNWWEMGGFPLYQSQYTKEGKMLSERMLDKGFRFLGLNVGPEGREGPVAITAEAKKVFDSETAAILATFACSTSRGMPSDGDHLTLLKAGDSDLLGGYQLGGWGWFWRFVATRQNADLYIPATRAILEYLYTHTPASLTLIAPADKAVLSGTLNAADIQSASDASLMRIEDSGMALRLVGEFNKLSDADLWQIKAALPEKCKATPAKPRKVLLFCRCEGSQNHWRGILGGNAAFILMGEKTGAFSCERAYEMDAFEPENLKRFDAIVFNNTTNLKFENPRHRAALLEFIRSGKGVMGLHAAADCFYDWKEGAEMMGGVAAGHPWIKCAIKLDDPQHPLLAAFEGKGFYFADEMYKIKEPYSRENLRVLLSFDLSRMTEGDANVGRQDKDNPVAWIHEFGKGRVFYSNIGHVQQDFFEKRIQEFFLDALQYVIGDLKADATPSMKFNPQPTPAAAHDQAAISNPRNVPGDVFPSLEEMKYNWPSFRGTGDGLAPSTNVPLRWDVSSRAGLLWKAVVPAQGNSSPIVWGDRVFLSGGDKTGGSVFCFNAGSGDLLWQRTIELPPQPGNLEWKVPESSGIASPTMVVDGHRAYAIFAKGDLAAFDFDGKQVWAKNLGLPENQYGHASSLALWQNRLIVQMDQGVQGDQKARLFAFDSATGQLIWENQRPVGSSWSSPIIAVVAGKAQVLALATPWAIAYDAKDGSELWRFGGMGGEMVPSPIYSAGLFYVISPSETLYAIKPDGQGDITKTNVAWSSDEWVPDICSPVSNGELLFTLTTSGTLTCFDAKNGKKQWEHDFEMEFRASPTIAGNRLYLLETTGKVVVLEVNRQFKELARSDLGEPLYASPAFTNDRIYIRSAKTLFCMGGK